ncbi:MAG: GNAT family N-acetyltransferase [Roseivirga sp.]|nr:GNAT family N-acetyltransferase [Roseivirga sp.]
MSQIQHSIREYEPKDKAACITIFNSNVPEYFCDAEREEFIEWLDKEDRAPYYVLLDGDLVLACGGIYEDAEEQMTGLAWGMVLYSKHKQGLGKQLTLHRLELMEKLFPHYAQHLSTSQHTEAFYKKFGFETTECIKDGFGPGLDNCKMRKEVKR